MLGEERGVGSGIVAGSPNTSSPIWEGKQFLLGNEEVGVLEGLFCSQTVLFLSSVITRVFSFLCPLLLLFSP